jgi:hypothetical protein
MQRGPVRKTKEIIEWYEDRKKMVKAIMKEWNTRQPPMQPPGRIKANVLQWVTLRQLHEM